MIVVGGGATGVGIAIDAASRGAQTLLLEQSDFGKGTSSRSTKLIHGGVRYLQQGNIHLVMEALKERGILRENAPHLVHDLPFVVPNYAWWEAPFYGIGMKVYDGLAGKYGFGPSRNLSRETTIERLPTIETEGLRGGVVYHDGQFDDARLLIHMAMTAADHGGVLANYMRVDGLLKDEHGFVSGVEATDLESGRRMSVEGRVVINATGAFSDHLRELDTPGVRPMIRPSQGVHIVLDRAFLPGDSAIMVPHTDDGRVLFAIPWQNRVLVGTTDTPVETVELEPRPFEEEIEFLLGHAARYLTKDPGRDDVLSVFVGLRPLVDASGGEDDETAQISREHTITISRTGLVTIAGGKWTTYRKMAEDVVDSAAALASLSLGECVTRTLRLHGYEPTPERHGALALYGSDAPRLERLIATEPGGADKIHPRLDAVVGEVVWAARHEMARTVDDVLARRTRALLLDARAAAEAAPRVAELLASELNRSPAWAEEQVVEFQALARGYVLD